MTLFKGRSSLLEVQNRALIKTAKERAAQIEKLERELQSFRERAEIEKVQRELQALQQKTERQAEEMERLTLERNFYSERASALEKENRELTQSAIQYSVQAQQRERELTEAATEYSLRAQKLERELTEAAAKYSLWGQKLERELARLDPDGAPARRFEAQHES